MNRPIDNQNGNYFWTSSSDKQFRGFTTTRYGVVSNENKWITMIDLYKIPCYLENEFDQQLTCCRPLPLDSPNFAVAQAGVKKGTTAALPNVSNYFSTEPTA
jgi:hypothetical protein